MNKCEVMILVLTRRVLFFLLMVFFMVSQVVAVASSEKFFAPDIVTMDFIPKIKTKEIFVGGYRGVLGKVVLSGNEARFNKIPAPLDMDVLVIRALTDNEALIGTSKGDVYRLIDNELKHLALLSEFKEPILDMAIKGDEVWVVGPRGLIAHSDDQGGNWKKVVIEQVYKKLTLASPDPMTWFFGVSNIDVDTLVFNATVNGKKAVDEKDYYFNASEGSIEIVSQLDQSSDLTISFNYLPGPQFQAGDVSFNTVSFYRDTVVIAGEFGTVISFEKENGWRSIYTELSNEESSLPYWMASNVKGDGIVLVGAGGVASFSDDAGESWEGHNLTNDNGVFGAFLTDDSQLIIAGAVGTIAEYKKPEWVMADRSELGLIAWLKSIVSLGDGAYLVSGGRGSMVLFENGMWRKIKLKGSH